MQFGRLITLSGVDCSGKTTQLDLLSTSLAEAGARVKTVWFRPGYSREMDFLRKTARRLRPTLLPDYRQTEARQQIFDKAGVSESWIAMALVDSLWQYAVKVRLYLARGLTVICDRFLQDAGLDLLLRFPSLQPIWRPCLKLVQTLTPTPDHAILFNLPYDVVTSRAIKKNEPFPDTDEVRWKRWNAYQEFARNGQFRVVNAENSISRVQSDVAAVVSS